MSPACDIARKNLVALDRADGEAGKVVVAFAVEPRHFRRLAADERCAGDAATFGDALDDCRRRFDIKRRGSEVIEEEEWLGTLDDEIVDAHCDKVDAERRVLAAFDRDLELCADSVGRRDKHGIAEAGSLGVEERAEAAEPAHDSGAFCGCRGGLDPLNQRHPGVDIDPGVAVGQGIAFVRHSG